MIIAFIGMTGTGKTTNAQSLYQKLKEMGFSVEYKPEFEYFLLNIVKSQIRVVETIRMKFHNSRSKPIPLRLWPFLVWPDSLIAWLFSKLLKAHKIIIHDNYLYNFLLDWERFGYSSNIIRRLFLGFPKPELAFVLDVPPQVSYERRGEK
jgi:thymidylate kinase